MCDPSASADLPSLWLPYIGHGVQHGDTIFCCVHCAEHEGVKGLRDRD
jgi:hypothetical protein